MARPICVVQQTDQCGPGRIAQVFARNGIGWVLCRAGDGEPLPAAQDTAGLILLGGPMSVHDPLDFLRAENRLVEAALRAEIPVLGICLGAQLIAQTLGATVSKAATPEIGWHAIWPSEQAPSDPVLRHLQPGQPVMQWHNERFDLPAGAVRLATSAHCENQAFRVGELVYGVQFHPEVTPDIVQGWIAADAACGPARECHEPINSQANQCLVDQVAERLFTAWAALFHV